MELKDVGFIDFFVEWYLLLSRKMSSSSMFLELITLGLEWEIRCDGRAKGLRSLVVTSLLRIRCEGELLGFLRDFLVDMLAVSRDSRWL